VPPQWHPPHPIHTHPNTVQSCATTHQDQSLQRLFNCSTAQTSSRHAHNSGYLDGRQGL
jgi:hypothetical protein